MALTDIATIVVSVASAGVTRPGYGVPLVLSHTAPWGDRIRFYANQPAVLVDFPANSETAMATQAIFSQSPSPPLIAVGRAIGIPQHTYSLWVASGITPATLQDYKLRVGIPTGTVYTSQDARYNSGGATVWSPSNLWSRGVLIANSVAGTINNLYSCLGPSGGPAGVGFTGFGGASGPSGFGAVIAENGVNWMFVGTGNTGSITNDAVINGLKSAIEFLGAPTCVGTGSNQILTSLQGSALARTLQLQSPYAGKFFGTRIYSRNALGGAFTTADPGVAADLATIKGINNAWYGLALTFQSKAINEAAAAWVEANTKIFPAQTAETAVATLPQSAQSDQGTDMQNQAYARSWTFFHPSSDEFAGAAELGRFLPLDPGSETWRMKTLAGITKEFYSDTETGNMNAKNAQYYYDIGGVAAVGGNANTAGGNYVDVTRFLDWYTANLQADLVNLALAVNKIPYTNAGIDMVEAAITARNRAGIKIGGIAPGTDVVIAPDVRNVLPSDKQARNLNNVVTTWTLAGAIHRITVSVTASF